MRSLIPWAILLVAVALKVWRFTRLVRQHLPPKPADLEYVRASLERSWQRDQQQA
ncbi:hypothetical protein [Cyanobium sp. CH-040]|uniref:hypothetical protein n=1 Tax=Cyanobium sp. CH-040 TaxID=2823708 RepID=UPI0020CD2C70|nr:hypothetical protein [Cyanobium sp. CH-040]MCP9927783.1 hypothetical protein [Cyanobium sp. CH-040]